MPTLRPTNTKATTAAPPLLLGTVTGATDEGHPLVRPDGSEASEPCETVWLPVALSWEHCTGLRVACQPLAKGGLLVTALMEAPPARGIIQSRTEAASLPAAQGPLHLENDKEIVLRCGKAKVALRADGRIEIIGGYLISRARKVNKIMGGSVQIN